MLKSVRTICLSVAFVAATAAAPAFAADFRGFHHPHPPAYGVPEIDAGSGLVAMAALIGALSLAWERRRTA